MTTLPPYIPKASAPAVQSEPAPESKWQRWDDRISGAGWTIIVMAALVMVACSAPTAIPLTSEANTGDLTTQTSAITSEANSAHAELTQAGLHLAKAPQSDDVVAAAGTAKAADDQIVKIPQQAKQSQADNLAISADRDKQHQQTVDLTNYWTKYQKDHWLAFDMIHAWEGFKITCIVLIVIFFLGFILSEVAKGATGNTSGFLRIVANIFTVCLTDLDDIFGWVWSKVSSLLSKMFGAVSHNPTTPAPVVPVAVTPPATGAAA